MLFPGGFWLDATLFIAMGTVVGAVILGGVGAGYFYSKSPPAKTLSSK
jgi:hypothetical protein